MDEGTAAALVETLCRATGRAHLDYVAQPTPLTGGFDAEMLRFRLADPPAELDGELVARLVRSPEVGAWEATMQREVAEQGFPTPAVRLTADESGPLGRYLIVMEHVDGRAPLEGLRLGTVLTQIPSIARGLPDQLAHVAAQLHSLDAAPLAERLAALGTSIPTTTDGFVERLSANADALGRAELVEVGERLVASEPRSSARVIAHGDLHPFNLLVGDGGVTLIDWTVGRVAHPAFTVAFTELVLANPPIPVPSVGAGALRLLGRNLARRFLSTYRCLTDGTVAAVDEANLEWHRKVHALRILVEMAGWTVDERRVARDHPWLVLEPVARRVLDLRA